MVILAVELSKAKTELDCEIKSLQGEVESKSALILTLQSQLEVIVYMSTNIVCVHVWVPHGTKL